MKKIISNAFIENESLEDPRSEATPEKDDTQSKIYKYAFTLRPTLSRLIKEVELDVETLKYKLLDICNQFDLIIISYEIEKGNHIHAKLGSDLKLYSYASIARNNRGWHTHFKQLRDSTEEARWDEYMMKDTYKQYSFI